MTITCFILRIQDITNITFLGHYKIEGKDADVIEKDGNPLVAGIGLGSVCVNLFGYQIILGLNGALDTLIS